MLPKSAFSIMNIVLDAIQRRDNQNGRGFFLLVILLFRKKNYQTNKPPYFIT